MNKVDYRKEKSGKKALLALKDLLTRCNEVESDGGLDHLKYEMIPSSWSDKNFKNHAFDSRDELKQFLLENKKYFVKKSFQSNFKKMFKSIEEYYLFLKEIFDNKIIEEHLFNILIVPLLNNETYDSSELEQLLNLRSLGLSMNESNYMSILSNTFENDELRKKLKEIPIIKQKAEFSESFMDDLEKFKFNPKSINKNKENNY